MKKHPFYLTYAPTMKKYTVWEIGKYNWIREDLSVDEVDLFVTDLINKWKEENPT